ncbi:hypothetical protein B4135_1122 [Caldibacillus debilis]|uniref:Rhodanese domain-containing protein n=1 Tax=Caldibacillus debilis TaxID=301148 RepID=A0A150MEC5_9BACI|nr:hypothetical protein B4135_1122 [Caldibacillus debilis]
MNRAAKCLSAVKFSFIQYPYGYMYISGVKVKMPFRKRENRPSLRRLLCRPRKESSWREEQVLKELSAKEVERLLQEGKKLNIIDVRETEEMAEGKIPGAVNIPLSILEFRLHELDQTKEYILVCRSGGRSGLAAELLASRGFRVINMRGGMQAWEGEVE